jgi:hypothetical protein
VNQAYTIATSAKVDVSAVNTAAFTDAFFAKSAKAEKKGDFIEGSKKVCAPSFSESHNLPLMAVVQPVLHSSVVPTVHDSHVPSVVSISSIEFI